MTDLKSKLVKIKSRAAYAHPSDIHLLVAVIHKLIEQRDRIIDGGPHPGAVKIADDREIFKILEGAE